MIFPIELILYVIIMVPVIGALYLTCEAVVIRGLEDELSILLEKADRMRKLRRVPPSHELVKPVTLIFGIEEASLRVPTRTLMRSIAVDIPPLTTDFPADAHGPNRPNYMLQPEGPEFQVKTI